jgi:SAM-dependent methyltransferase
MHINIKIHITMKINTKHQKKSNPVHIDMCALSWLSKQSPLITISPKADGTYTELKYNNHIYQAEYIKDLNIYLIFDTLTYPIKHSNTLINRYEWITKQHPSKIPTHPQITSISQLITIITENTTILKTYLSTKTKTHDQLKWFPKITLQLNLSPQSYLSLLDTNIDNILPYKTDGWITTSLKEIGHLSKQIYKYKPKDELTIDVLYKDNEFYGLSDNKLISIKNIILPNPILNQSSHIYRCYWDPTINHFIPKDIRNDKLYPNSINVINDIETLHKNYWSATILSQSPQYYYDNTTNNLDQNYIKYLQIQREIFKTNIIIIVQITNSKTIIDIGCGKGYILKFLKNKQLTLVDINPSNIYILKNNPPTDQTKYICANMNDYIINQTQPNDLIIFNNSLHYINNLSILINNIAHYKYMYIHGLDRDMIPTTFTHNNIIITPPSNTQTPTYIFNYPWKTETFDEPIISFSSLISLMEHSNWKIEKIFNHDNNDDKFIQIHKYILFKNNNH